MEDITQSDTPITSEQTSAQPRPLVLALMFTGILYFSVSPRLINNNARVVSPSIQTSANFSKSVANAVLQDLSQKLKVPKSDFRIVRAQQQTWRDYCLGINDSNNSCTQALIPGWHVTVVSGERHWVYRTNASGSVVKLDLGNQDSPRIAIAPLGLQ